MTTSAKNILRWKAELEINKRLANTGSKRFRWLRRLYVRVFQFLLSRYDEGLPSQSQAIDSAPSDGDHVSTMPFVDLTLDHRGLQARLPQSLRGVLEQIHSYQPVRGSAETGEQDQCKTPEWVVVATSHDYRLSSCEVVLTVQGIKFRRSAVGRYRALEVRFEDRNAAFVALRGFPHRQQELLRRLENQRAPTVFLSLEDTNPIWLFLIFLALLIAALLSFLIIDEMRASLGSLT